MDALFVEQAKPRDSASWPFLVVLYGWGWAGVGYWLCWMGN